MQRTHLWHLKIINNKNKNKILIPEHFFFYFDSLMAKTHGNENCRGTVNMYQIRCNLPLERMNSKSNNF